MTQPRIVYMDAIRLFSALCVVLIHAVNPVAFSFAYISPGSWWLANILNIIGRASVPLFVMLSGALLLDSSRKKEPDSVMFKKRLWHVVLLFMAWSIIYFLWRSLGLHQYLTLPSMLSDIFAGTSGEQLYFLPLIAGLYIITPLLRIIVWNLTLHRLTLYTTLLLVMAAGWQLLSNLPGDTAPSYNIANQFVPFIGYYLLGYIMMQLPIRRISHWVFLGAYAAGIIIPSIMTYLFVSNILVVGNPHYFYDFINPFIILQAIGAWGLWMRYFPSLQARWPRIQTIVHQGANATLALYLIHIIVLQFSASYVLGFPAAQHPYTYILLQVLGAGGVSIILSLILCHLPYIRRLVT